MQRLASVCSRRLPPQRPQQQRLVEALLGGQLCRVLGVGVVLDVGQDDGVAALLRRAGRGVEVAHDDVGTAVERPAVAVARVAGNDGIAGRRADASEALTGQAEMITQRDITTPSSATPSHP